MLYELYVENFALIKRMRMPLREGVNALTGETGAGKSLVVDALGLLIGGRGNDGFIRSGDDRCLIEGVFLPPFPPALAELPEAAPDEAGNLILCRELVRGGRSLARINGRTMPLTKLKEIGQQLLNIHGQHEYTQLLQEERQLTLVDSFGEAPLLQALEKTGAAFTRLAEARRRLRDYQDNQAARESRLDKLKYLIDELEAAAPQAGEDEQLQAEARLLAHGEKLYQFAGSCHQALDGNGGAVEKLDGALAELRQAAVVDPQLEPLFERLQSAYYEVKDIAGEAMAYRDKVDLDAFRLDEVESRIALLSKLKKKYGGSIEAMLERLAEARAEHGRLEEISVSGEAYRKELEKAEAEYAARAALLTRERRRAAKELSRDITGELHQLCMPNALFRVDLPEHPPSSLGNERALFMIRPNLGEPFQPVDRIASGGELSRIVLGIKVILARLDEVPVLVFDEVDTGLSGRALVAVAERLNIVGRTAQAICVSHAAVMAAAASHHILIEKHEEEGRTVIAAHILAGEERLKELARMIAGTKSGATTLKQAQEMLDAMRG